MAPRVLEAQLGLAHRDEKDLEVDSYPLRFEQHLVGIRQRLDHVLGQLGFKLLLVVLEVLEEPKALEVHGFQGELVLQLGGQLSNGALFCLSVHFALHLPDHFEVVLGSVLEERRDAFEFQEIDEGLDVGLVHSSLFCLPIENPDDSVSQKG